MYQHTTTIMLAFLITDERPVIRHKCSAHILQVRMSKVDMQLIPPGQIPEVCGSDHEQYTRACQQLLPGNHCCQRRVIVNATSKQVRIRPVLYQYYTSIIQICKPCKSLREGHIIGHWHECKRSQQYWEHAYACQRSRASINFKLSCKCLCKNKACHRQSVQTADMLAPDVTKRRVSALATSATTCSGMLMLIHSVVDLLPDCNYVRHT